jgi:lysophospholipase L1-like esterase
MSGIDVKTFGAAKKYAEMLALGGKGLQETVETKVNEYLAKEGVKREEYENDKNGYGSDPSEYLEIETTLGAYNKNLVIQTDGAFATFVCCKVEIMENYRKVAITAYMGDTTFNAVSGFINENDELIERITCKDTAENTYEIPENAKYVLISCYTKYVDTPSVRFCDVISTISRFARLSDLPTNYQVNYLEGKTILAIGDSMVYGHSLGTNKTWLAKMAERNNATWINKGTNGAFMSNKQYNSADNSVYQKLCVSDCSLYIDDSTLAECDYILIFAGTNDTRDEITIGETDSTIPEEFCGALNLICKTLQTRCPSAKIGFITPYLRKGIEEQCKTYNNAIHDVCEKYSIPVFDNGTQGGICWSNTAQIETLTLNDTYHLNESGMEYASYKYESFLKSL